MGNPSKITENSPFQFARQIEIRWPLLHTSKRVCCSPLDKVWPIPQGDDHTPMYTLPVARPAEELGPNLSTHP